MNAALLSKAAAKWLKTIDARSGMVRAGRALILKAHVR
jgi:hypothetical protein